MAALGDYLNATLARLWAIFANDTAAGGMASLVKPGNRVSHDKAGLPWPAKPQRQFGDLTETEITLADGADEGQAQPATPTFGNTGLAVAGPRSLASCQFVSRETHNLKIVNTFPNQLTALPGQVLTRIKFLIVQASPHLDLTVANVLQPRLAGNSGIPYVRQIGGLRWTHSSPDRDGKDRIIQTIIVPVRYEISSADLFAS